MSFRLTALFIAAALALATGSPLEPRSQNTPHRSFRITNNCPTQINLITAGVFDGVIPVGASTERYGTPGPFYTDANGGRVDGTGSTKAFFSGDWHYTIVRDPNYLNTAISISPHVHENAPVGLCVTVICPTSICNQGLDATPGANELPAPNQAYPNLPWHSCPDEDSLQWDITFCPGGLWPQYTQGGIIVPMRAANKCLDVHGAIFANGSPVQVYDCNGTAAQRWVLTRSPTGPGTQVRVAGTNYCLDAGASPANGVQLKIWTCLPNIPAQLWNWDSFGARLSLAGVYGGKTFCVDVREGSLANDNPVHTWECASSNPNQVFSHPY